MYFKSAENFYVNKKKNEKISLPEYWPPPFSVWSYQFHLVLYILKAYFLLYQGIHAPLTVTQMKEKSGMK